MAGEADRIAADVQAKWAAAFARLDAEALSSLYSKHALFFGSNPTLYRGRNGVRTYFEGLPRWQSQGVEFTDVVTETAGAELVSMAGTRVMLHKKAISMPHPAISPSSERPR